MHNTFRKDVSLGTVRLIHEKFPSFSSGISGLIDWDKIPDEYIAPTQLYLREKAFPSHVRPILNDLAGMLGSEKNVTNLLQTASDN